MGATINMLSLFGFIVTLGIVVDDAVVVVEAIKLLEGQIASDNESPVKDIDNINALILGGKTIEGAVFFEVEDGRLTRVDNLYDTRQLVNG